MAARSLSGGDANKGKKFVKISVISGKNTKYRRAYN